MNAPTPPAAVAPPIDDAALALLCEQLNAALSDNGVTPYKLAVLDPKTITPLERNAHYMPKRIYDQLRANIARDKNLTSLPFCWRTVDGAFICLSGNHRVKGAADAGIPRILVLYTDADLTQDERIAIQLAHNALVGNDNPGMLRELWSQISDLKLKIYSGLDSESLKTLEPVSITRINEAALRFQELRVMFLSPEIDKIEDLLKRLGKPGQRRWAARYADYDAFFDFLLTFKESTGIVNTATAMMRMVEICEAHLEAEAAKAAEADPGSSDAPHA